MTEPIFHREGDRYVPTGHARGPWDPGMQHGGAPGALIARAIEALAPEMAVARLTVEFLAAVPLEPVSVDAALVKPGRNLQIAEATLSSGDRPTCLARAVLLRRAPVEGAGSGTAAPPLTAGPDDGGSVPFGAGPEGEGFHLTGMEIRFTVGSFNDSGPAQAWYRFLRPLVGGESLSPAQRAVAAADFGNGASRELDWRHFLFVNTDLSVLLHREPAGEWVGLDAATAIGDDGRGLASSVLHDEQGALGAAHQTLFVAAR